MKFQTFGVSTPEESQRERDHKAIARRAAVEGIVLLKNDGVLPLMTRKVALYGPGSRMTVKGGSGSGDVRERHSVTIGGGAEGMQASPSRPHCGWTVSKRNTRGMWLLGGRIWRRRSRNSIHPDHADVHFYRRAPDAVSDLHPDPPR